MTQVPKDNVFKPQECLRPPCGDGWSEIGGRYGDPKGQVCPEPNMSPVWFSGSWDVQQTALDVTGAAAYSSSMPTKVYSAKDAAGNHKKYKLGGYGRAGLIGGAIMLGVSMANNIEEEHWTCSPCMHGQYYKIYFDEEHSEGMNCELNPYQPCPDIKTSETRCCDVTPMPWQRTEGHKWHDGLPRCHNCPAWTIKNSIVSTDYMETRCFVDCSNAFASMRVHTTTTQDFINDLQNKGFKSNNAEAVWSEWSTKAAIVQMEQVQTRGNPEVHHFVPGVEVWKEGPVCTPCAEGTTKFTSRNPIHHLFGPSGEWLGMDESVSTGNGDDTQGVRGELLEAAERVC